MVAKIKRTVAIVILAGLVPLALWANRLSPQASRGSTGHCYCGCTHGKAKGECSKLCDLPRYEGRSWAGNCQRPPARHSRKAPTTHPQHDDDDDDDGPELARR